jgi:hypothetical protein
MLDKNISVKRGEMRKTAPPGMRVAFVSQLGYVIFSDEETEKEKDRARNQPRPWLLYMFIKKWPNITKQP